MDDLINKYSNLSVSDHIKKYGQYFTTDNTLKEKMYEFILNQPNTILEPSVGRGDLISKIIEKHDVNSDLPKFIMYEIDSKLTQLNITNPKTREIQKLEYYGDLYNKDFLEEKINMAFDTIVGNPPYVKIGGSNLYIKFVEKCVNLLNTGGELIFIVPSDLFKLTSSCNLLNKMLLSGKFTHIYHPHNDKLFKNATIDILIFRYVKNDEHEEKEQKYQLLYNNEKKYLVNSNGMIIFSNKIQTNVSKLSDIFDIYVGLVSGRKKIYKQNIGNIEVINGYNVKNKFIFIDEFPSNDEKINSYLLEHKEELLSRKIRKFNSNNWFKWGAPRNKKIMEAKKGGKCIYMYNLTRHEKISWVDKVQYFGGNLLILIPKNDIDLENITNYFNSNEFKNNFIQSGRFKIGHKQLSNFQIELSHIM